jgi:hypothetical protein
MGAMMYAWLFGDRLLAGVAAQLRQPHGLAGWSVGSMLNRALGEHCRRTMRREDTEPRRLRENLDAH